jgi:transcriptional antiterminator Rof (Rho-off)
MNTDRPISDYQPISCANYDQYEIAIMHHARLHLTWQEDNVIYDQIVTPLNLRTQNSAEYLILRDATGATREVRLDHIRRMQPLPANSA